MGLNESYAHVRSQILIMNPLPSVGQAYSIVAQEESHRSLMSTAPQVLEPASIFYYARGKFNDKKKELITCEYCKWTGHSKEKCYKLVGYPVGHRLHRAMGKGLHQKFQKDGYNSKNVNMSNNCDTSTADSNVSSVPGTLFTSEQYVEIFKLLNKDRALDISNQPEVNMAGTPSLSPSQLNSPWIIDSGANDHMVGRNSVLLDSRPCDSFCGSVKMPNGTTTNVSNLGSIAITDSITLHNVLQVLAFNHNLLSISPFTKENYCSVIFYPHFCLFQDLRNGKIMGIGKEHMDCIFVTHPVLSLHPQELMVTNAMSPLVVFFILLIMLFVNHL